MANAYDAMELGVNMYIRNQGLNPSGINSKENLLKMMDDIKTTILDKLPTMNSRSDDKIGISSSRRRRTIRSGELAACVRQERHGVGAVRRHWRTGGLCEEQRRGRGGKRVCKEPHRHAESYGF